MRRRERCACKTFLRWGRERDETVQVPCNDLVQDCQRQRRACALRALDVVAASAQGASAGVATQSSNSIEELAAVPSEATPSSCAMTGWISDIVALNEPAGANNSLAAARDQGEPKD